jgi:hypothetical protein
VVVPRGLAALAAHAGLRCLELGGDLTAALGAAVFRALAEAAWPSLTRLRAELEYCCMRDLGSASFSFAGCSKLEELHLEGALGEAGARVLHGEGCRARQLRDDFAKLSDAGMAALASGEGPLAKSHSKYDTGQTKRRRQTSHRRLTPRARPRGRRARRRARARARAGARRAARRSVARAVCAGSASSRACAAAAASPRPRSSATRQRASRCF